MANHEIVVQVTAPLEVAEKLRANPVKGVDFEPPTGGREQTTRFGLAEAALLLAVCAGVEKVVKLGSRFGMHFARSINREPRAAKPELPHQTDAYSWISPEMTPWKIWSMLLNKF